MQAEPNGKFATPLDVLLERTIEALSVLDAEALEEIAATSSRDFADGPIFAGLSRADWARAVRLHWVLGHLLVSTGQRLALLRRISLPAANFQVYGPGSGVEPPLASIADPFRYRAPHGRS